MVISNDSYTVYATELPLQLPLQLPPLPLPQLFFLRDRLRTLARSRPLKRAARELD